MQHDQLTPEELAALPEKTKKHPAVVDLYLQHDYLTAYAKHTDMRVAESPEGAIGNHLEWDRHGLWQKDFLVSQGLRPHHSFLEIGCGTGRLARQVVPMLGPGNYAGVDLSASAIGHATKLSRDEGWHIHTPCFFRGSADAVPNEVFDFVWAFSVFIHLPADVMRDVFQECAKRMHADSWFYFSYVPEISDTRTGCKQFRHMLGTYKRACRDAGLSFKDVPWPHQQRIGVARRVDLGTP